MMMIVILELTLLVRVVSVKYKNQFKLSLFKDIYSLFKHSPIKIVIKIEANKNEV